MELVNTCPTCKNIALPTKVSAEEWNTTSDTVKERILQNLEAETKQSNSKASNSNSSDSFISAAKIFGIIYITLSVIGGIVIMSEVNAAVGIAAIFLGSLSGFLIMCVGQIISLLQDIKDKLNV